MKGAVDCTSCPNRLLTRNYLIRGDKKKESITHASHIPLLDARYRFLDFVSVSGLHFKSKG